MISETIKKELKKIEKQLLCFETTNIYDKYKECLCKQFANFLLSLKDNKKNIKKSLENFDSPYKENIEIKEKKLYFKTYDINKIAVLVFEKLYEEDSNTAFDNYINFIESYIYENTRWFYLDFSIYNEDENIHIKNSFFNGALKYLNGHKISLEEYYNVLKEKEFCKFDIQITDDIDMFYYFLKNSKFSDCFVNHWYDNQQIDKIFNLLTTIIKFYDYNTNYIYYEKENPIFKLLDLKNDFINATILLSDNIKLNIFLLKHFNYFVIGFINLIEILIQNCNEDYFKFLSDELIEILFKHFHRLDKKNEFYKKIFVILNILSNKYHQSYIYKNSYIFYYKYLLDKFFDFLTITEINEDTYKKVFLFDFIFNDLVNLQIRINKLESYLLLSKYFKLANSLSIKNENLHTLLLNKLENLLNMEKLYIDFKFVEKIDFSVFYSPLDKFQWLNLIEIAEKKQTWQEIQAERRKKRTISSNDRQEPKHQTKLYFKILNDIFIKTYDKDIQNKLIELAKHFGLDVNNGIFEDFIWDRDYFYEKFLKILNLFDDKFFDIFLYELQIRTEIFKLIKLYNYTHSLKRKEKILNTIGKLELNDINLWKKFQYNKQNVIEAIELLISNELFELANKILDFIDFYNEDVSYLKCEKEILDLFFDNKINKDEKFNKLHQIKYSQYDTNKGTESFYKKCEEYKTLIRALIFFDNEPEKTAIILENEMSKAFNYKKLYYVNLIESRIKVFIKNRNSFNFIKLKNIIKEYNNFLIINRLNNDIFDYKAFLSAYIELNDYINASLIIDKLPSYYLRDFELIVLKYKFLKKFKSELKAANFLNNQKKFLTDNEIKKIEEEKLEDLFSYKKEIREHLRKTLEYNFAISFAGEYRFYMQILAKELRKLGYKVFLDKEFETKMISESLNDYLTKTFKYKTEYVIIFVSKEYKEKFYTNQVERKAIIDKEYFQDCIILLQFDNTVLNEIPKDIFYIDLRDKKLEEIDWRKIAKKLKEKYESIGV